MDGQSLTLKLSQPSVQKKMNLTEPESPLVETLSLNTRAPSAPKMPTLKPLKSTETQCSPPRTLLTLFLDISIGGKEVGKFVLVNDFLGNIAEVHAHLLKSIKGVFQIHVGYVKAKVTIVLGGDH